MIRRTTRFVAAIVVALSLADRSPAQSVGFAELRPFVTSIIPVIGPSGSVGGVSIDAAGVLARSHEDSSNQLRDARRSALKPVAADPDVSRPSPRRHISLRGLQEAIDQCRLARRPLADDLLNLAGLTRIEFVFVDPEHQDILLAGPAQPGQTPVLLDDLIVALRTAKAATTGRGISCSIDPTEDGLRRLRPLLNGRTMSENSVARMEQALGPQQITITGVPPTSHFARVLVAADFLMKRLGMNFEPAPIDGLPSYLELLQSRSAPPPKNAMPRWWMAPHYEPLLTDGDGLAWQLRGPGVQTLTESGYLQPAADGAKTAKEDALAQQWAAAMTSNYDALCRALPIFSELRHCMDLAVVAALITKENLPSKAGCDLSLLLDDRRLAIAEYPAPQTVASQASLVRKGSGWILSLSGGVQVDSWSVLQHVETNSDLPAHRDTAFTSRADRWWWD